MNPDQPQWVLGLAGNHRGIRAALVQTDGARIAALGPGAGRAWSRAEARQLSTGGAAAAELAETAAATLATALCARSDAPLPVLAGLEISAAAAPDARIIAGILGLPVVWDFRSADRALGGAGRPLAPAFLHALARWRATPLPLAFLHLGRLATLCHADPEGADPGDGRTLAALDAGPGPGMLPPRATGDATGNVAREIVQMARDAGFRARMPPRHIDTTDLAGLGAALAGLGAADAAATLHALVADCVADALGLLPALPAEVLVTGPGRRDAPLRRALAHSLPVPVRSIEDAGLDDGWLTAASLAHLAMRIRRGLPTSFAATTGVAAAVGGGQIAPPAPAPPA